LRKVNCGGSTGAAKNFAGYRWFESISLQRRVSCQPDFRDHRVRLPSEAGDRLLEMAVRAFKPIVGATKLHHLDDSIAAINVKLSAEEIAALEESYVPHALAGFE
jgi:hypothetical protein